MADKIAELKASGVLTPELENRLSDSQRQVLDNLSDSEVKSLIAVRNKIKPTTAEAAPESGGGLYF